MKPPLYLLFSFIAILSCSSDHYQNGQNQASISFTKDSNVLDNPVELTQEQERAFAALNSIQVQGQNLYSTFAGIQHECSSVDTSYIMGQVQFLLALKKLISIHYTIISKEEGDKLASAAVLAQEKYLLVLCNDNSIEVINGADKDVPYSGTWILPNVLGRRDIIITW